jgi:hypothetical protein
MTSRGAGAVKDRARFEVLVLADVAARTTLIPNARAMLDTEA